MCKSVPGIRKISKTVFRLRLRRSIVAVVVVAVVAIAVVVVDDLQRKRKRLISACKLISTCSALIGSSAKNAAANFGPKHFCRRHFRSRLFACCRLDRGHISRRHPW